MSISVNKSAPKVTTSPSNPTTKTTSKKAEKSEDSQKASKSAGASEETEVKTPEPAPAPPKPSKETKLAAKQKAQTDMAAQHAQASIGAKIAPKYRNAPSMDKVTKKKPIRSGHKGQPVKDVQKMISDNGIKIKEDGYFGPKTKKAVLKFQKTHGLKEDGLVGPETLKHLKTPNSTSIKADPNFKKLNKATQGEVTKHLDANAKDLDARNNIGELVKNPGFAKLNPTHQKEMLAAQAKAPKDKKLSEDLNSLAGNKNFQKLNNKTKSDVIKGFGKNAADPDVRENISDLATADGFAKLGDTHRKEMLDLQAKHPKNKKLTADLVDLAKSPGFKKLGDGAKSGALREIGRHPKNPAARQTIKDLASNPGFAKMGDEEKDKLLRYVGGTNKEISSHARGAMAKMLKDPAFKGASTADQTKKLEQFIRDQKGLPGVVSAQPTTFDATRRPYTLGKPKEVKNHKFNSGKATALKYEVEIDGRKIPVYMPKKTDATKGKFHTIDEVAKALAAQPKSSRDLIKHVNVNPDRNPKDDYWAKKYKSPGFRSYMTAGKSGVVDIYPSKSKKHQGRIDGDMIHETGHIYSRKNWGSDSSKKWKPWQKAMKKDNFVASGYAKKSVGEDFSEALQIYNQVKGTPKEAELRALMPERFKMLDKITSGK